MRSATVTVVVASVILGCALAFATVLIRGQQIGPPTSKQPQLTQHAVRPPIDRLSKITNDVHRLRSLADKTEADRQLRAAKESMWIACEQLNSGSVEALISGDRCGDEPYPTEETPEEQEKVAKINAYISYMNTAIGGCMANVAQSATFADTMAEIQADISKNRSQSQTFDQQRLAKIKACVKAQTGYD
jgi:hypothetical protein